MNLIRVIRKLRKRDPLKYLPRGYAAPFDPTLVDDDERLLMMANAAHDPRKAQTLLAKHQADHAHQVIGLLPGRKRPSIRLKLLHWLQWLEGSSDHNPFLSRPRHRDRGYYTESDYRPPIKRW